MIKYLIVCIILITGCERSTIEERACVFCEGEGFCMVGYIMCNSSAGMMNTSCTSIIAEDKDKKGSWETKEQVECMKQFNKKYSDK